MEFSIGNHKLGKDTIILNMTSATDCPGRALGLCSMGAKCYAMKAERQYPACLPFRRRQAEQWDRESVTEIFKSIALRARRVKTPIQYVRLSEAGDFRTQADVEKANRLAILLSAINIRMYGYTARKDLNFTNLHDNFVMNGTNFMIDNSFNPVPMITGKLDAVCDGDCPNCTLCKVKEHKNIEIKMH